MKAEDLKKWRETMGFTQEKAAEVLGYQRPYYADFERGVRNIPFLVPIACAAIWLGIKPWPDILKGFRR
jgi:transcriptional regulator with XRE-family HTH domain